MEKTWKRAGVAVILAVLLSLFSLSIAAEADSEDLTGTWHGTVTWPQGNFPATVHITQSAPLRATIDIAGICKANWVEKERIGNSVLVHATVTWRASTCVDGDWALIVTDTKMAGPSPDHPGQFITLGKGSSTAPSLTCADQRASALDNIAPGSEAGVGVVLQRLAGLPRWFSSTLLIAACIPEALDANPGGGVPDLWKNINSQEFFTAICRTGEAVLDPLNLGYTKNFLCGTPVG